MAIKILLVEDTKEYRDKYTAWLSEMGYTVIAAKNVREGLEAVGREMPDAIITDHGLPDGNGNDFAKAVKDEYKVSIAGISTASDVFSSDIDIPETKDISKEGFGKLVESLFSGNPAAKYQEYKASRSLETDDRNTLLAASITFQGHYLATALRAGLEEIAVDGQVEISKADMAAIVKNIGGTSHIGEPSSIFHFFEEEETCRPSRIYEAACKANPALREDRRFSGVFERLGNKDYALSLEDSIYAVRKINEINKREDLKG